MADKKKRKADELAGEKSFTEGLKERRERIESGDLKPQEPVGERTADPVTQANLRAQARIERLRKQFKK